MTSGTRRATCPTRPLALHAGRKRQAIASAYLRTPWRTGTSPQLPSCFCSDLLSLRRDKGGTFSRVQRSHRRVFCSKMKHGSRIFWQPPYSGVCLHSSPWKAGSNPEYSCRPKSDVLYHTAPAGQDFGSRSLVAFFFSRPWLGWFRHTWGALDHTSSCCCCCCRPASTCVAADPTSAVASRCIWRRHVLNPPVDRITTLTAVQCDDTVAREKRKAAERGSFLKFNSYGISEGVDQSRSAGGSTAAGTTIAPVGSEDSSDSCCCGREAA